MSRSEQRTASRGLATVAMLKVNFDAGRDHIGMFEPFVLDAVARLEMDNLTVEDVRSQVASSHDMVLPANTLRTLLGRLTQKGFLRREAGRYFVTNKPIDAEDIERGRTEAEARQKRLARALRDSAEGRGVRIPTDEDALALILRFLEKYHVGLAFETLPDYDPVEEQAGDAKKAEVATAAFLRDTIAADGDLSEVIQEMLEGFVLQNTLLLKDISTAERQFQDLHVFVDSQLLFGALGMRGVATETATLELLELLRETGALLDVFEPTIDEMRRVLAVYESLIGTSEGRQKLHPTDLTRHFLSQRATPSDIRMATGLIESKLRTLGFSIREVPDHRPQWTLDETALADLLSDHPGGETDPRVVHDVDCVAGVITYRRGQASDSLDKAAAVFVTSSGMTVRNTGRWYSDQGGRGFPPIVHYLALSNHAWLKKPASASKLKVDELVALCTAALRPSREAWGRFIEHLRTLEASGELSSDEVTAVIASDLTDNVLVEEGIDDESDAESLSEVVERVKASYQVSARKAIDEARAHADGKAEEAARSASDAKERELRGRVERRAEQLASVLAWTAVILLGLSLVVGTVLVVASAASGSAISVVGIILAVVPLAVISLLGTLTGFNLRGWREGLQHRLAKRLEQLILKD